MTDRQKEIYDDLKKFIETKGYTPTVREFGEYVGLNSPSTVQWYFNLFENEGLIKRINNRVIKIMEVKNEINNK